MGRIVKFHIRHESSKMIGGATIETYRGTWTLISENLSHILFAGICNKIFSSDGLTLTIIAGHKASIYDEQLKLRAT